MNLLASFWSDESGAVSAELVAVGVVAVSGAGLGLAEMTSSMNKELTSAAQSIKSLDQSMVVRGRVGRHAWSGATTYIQPEDEQKPSKGSEPGRDAIPAIALSGMHAVEIPGAVDVPDSNETRDAGFTEEDLPPLVFAEDAPEGDAEEPVIVPASVKR